MSEESGELTQLHLADLHARAAELELEGFRRLRREELIAEIERAESERGGRGSGGITGLFRRRRSREEAREGRGGRKRGRGKQPPPEADEPQTPAEPSETPGEEVSRAPGRAKDTDGRDRDGDRHRRGRGDDDARARGASAKEEPDEVEAVKGTLDLMPQRFGFLRLRGLEPHPDDVYVSASQVRRLELRAGDEVEGPARKPRRGERHRALVHVDRVNGAEPGSERPAFEDLTPVPPSHRLELDPPTGDESVLVRSVDLLTPLAKGQRVLISAAPRSGRTSLLRAMAASLSGDDALEVIVLLVDERPEEATRWRERLPDARLAIATAEMSPADQRRLAELAVARAKRLMEAGRDVVLLVDSLTRLAAAGEDPGSVKSLFGAGRAVAEEGAGSLTVIATVLGDVDDPAERAVLTTENVLLRLDPELAREGRWPAIDARGTEMSGEQDVRGADEAKAAARLRRELAALDQREAADRLAELVSTSKSDSEILRDL